MVRRRALGLTIALLALLSANCSGDAPDVPPEDPEALALAAMPSAEALNLDGWQATDSSFEEMFPEPDPEATPFPFLERFPECDADALTEVPSRPDGVLGGLARSFFRPQPGLGASSFIFIDLRVFETRREATEAFEETARDLASRAEDSPVGEDCELALTAAGSGIDADSAMIVRRERDPGFAIRGVEVHQIRRTLASSGGVDSTVTTTAVFARGHIVVVYTASEPGDPENEDAVVRERPLDHEALINALIQHVTDAQLQQ